jgi:methionine-rich copper-binding protein CopC
LAAVSLLSIAPAVLAHAELATITPADKSTVPAPTTIVATFTEDLDASGSKLVLVDAGGKVVAQGGAVDATDKKKLRLDLSSTALAPGAYTVRWTSKSADDGDLDRNMTTFTVVPASPSPSAAPSVAVSPSAEASASIAPSVETAASPSPTGESGTPASSTSDAVIPIVVVLVVLALLGLWLLRGRSRRAG